MGWLWGSSPEAAKADEGGQGPKRDFSLTEEQRSRIFGGYGSQPQGSGRKGPSKEDEGVEEFLNALISDGKQNQAAQEPPVSGRKDEASSTPTLDTSQYDRYNPDGSLNIHPTALYPATMSCRQAFDQAFYCQSLGGKFNDLYRFGHLHDCSEQWGAFWFCMRVRTLPEKEREVKIREYYRERDERRVRARGGSSEDVWELRTVAVKEAFQRNPDEDDRSVGIKE